MTDEEIGAPPHPQPWPDDPRLDETLLREGDRRNVIDRYRYWSVASIAEDLDRRRHPFHVAVENWQRDPNVGAIVRNANAFGAAAVHIVGRRQWNRRGAMMTEVYQHIESVPTTEAFVAWAGAQSLPIVAIDNVAGAVSLTGADLPRACVFIFGEEGPGLSTTAREAAHALVEIPQFGSTRSINAGAASAVVMYEWCRRHAR